MKNPMTPEEMCQAVMDNAAGYDMQTQSLTSIGNDWMDRNGDFAGRDLNFALNKYRRKPELIKQLVNVYPDGKIGVNYDTPEEAISNNPPGTVTKTICLVEDTTWTKPEPEETNPWRPIIKGEWPKCKPDSLLKIKGSTGQIWQSYAGYILWRKTFATEWKYAEDE